MKATTEHLQHIAEKMCVQGKFLEGIPFGSGHINDTYRLAYEDASGAVRKYTFQRINDNVFPNPPEVMENIDRVTTHLQSKIAADRSGKRRETVRLLKTADNQPYYLDADGNYWRAYHFVENVNSFNTLSNPDQAYQIAKSFGEFQCDLADLPGKRLNETIKDFHHTPNRFAQLWEAVKNDRAGRLKDVAKELDYFHSVEEECGTLVRALNEGAVPERVTHNDTKCNNILLDEKTNEGACVIDLDTVMPGLVHYDFGDMVRGGTGSTAEDEVDDSKVYMRKEMFEGLLKGYLESAKNFLTPAETELLPLSGKIITLEIGTRFLADYLNGDIYFKTSRPNHNLDRARVQIALGKSIGDALPELMKML